MKTTLIQIDEMRDGSYYIAAGIGLEIEKYEWFAGIVIQFLYWQIRIGIHRKVK